MLSLSLGSILYAGFSYFSLLSHMKHATDVLLLYVALLDQVVLLGTLHIFCRRGLLLRVG